MTRRSILAIALCAGFAMACQDGATTPTAPSPGAASPGAAYADAQGTPFGPATADAATPTSSAPASTPDAPSSETPSNANASHDGAIWTDPSWPIRSLSPGTQRTTWLTVSVDPVNTGTWTQVESCSGSSCWTHDMENEPHDFEQVNSCTKFDGTYRFRRCWTLTRAAGDGVVTARFSRSGYTTQGQTSTPWRAIYYPNGRGTDITSAASCAVNGVASPLECTFRIPASACEPPELYYGWWLPAQCRVTEVTLRTVTGTGTNFRFQIHKACVRTRAVVDGETVTGDYGNCR